MKFFIHGDTFQREPEAGETVPLRAKHSNRMLFLKSTAAALLDAADRWVEFDAFAAGADETLKKDYRDGLTLLECFDLAELADLPEPDTNGCRVAGERDYKAVGAFLCENLSKGRSLAAITDPLYYTEDHVRARQFMNREYNFLRERDGVLQAVLVVAVPKSESVSSVVSLESIAFEAALTEREAGECLAALVDFAEQEFRGDLAKLRFIRSDDSQDWMVDRLVQAGFHPVCTLEKELNCTRDVTFYDRMIGASA